MNIYSDKEMSKNKVDWFGHLNNIEADDKNIELYSIKVGSYKYSIKTNASLDVVAEVEEEGTYSIPTGNAQLVYGIEGKSGEEFEVTKGGTMLPIGNYRVISDQVVDREHSGLLGAFSSIEVERIGSKEESELIEDAEKFGFSPGEKDLKGSLKKKASDNPVTSDMGKFGYREMNMAADLMKAYANNNFKKGNFFGDEVKVFMNANSGSVFLSDSDYRVGILNDEGQVEEWFSCPECGEEGFVEDIKASGTDCEDCHSIIKQEIGEYIVEEQELEYDREKAKEVSEEKPEGEDERAAEKQDNERQEDKAKSKKEKPAKEKKKKSSLKVKSYDMEKDLGLEYIPETQDFVDIETDATVTMDEAVDKVAEKHLMELNKKADSNKYCPKCGKLLEDVGSYKWDCNTEGCRNMALELGQIEEEGGPYDMNTGQQKKESSLKSKAE